MSVITDSEYNEFRTNFYEEIDKLKYERLKDKLGNIQFTEKSYYFLTINPPPTISLVVFLKTIQKAMSKRWITFLSFIYIYIYIYIYSQLRFS